MASERYMLFITITNDFEYITTEWIIELGEESSVFHSKISNMAKMAIGVKGTNTIHRNKEPDL